MVWYCNSYLDTLYIGNGQKTALIGIFRPDVSTLRRYKSSILYVNGEGVTGLPIYSEIKGQGFQ